MNHVQVSIKRDFLARNVVLVFFCAQVGRHSSSCDESAYVSLHCEYLIEEVNLIHGGI